jgi:hypothetical protein
MPDVPKGVPYLDLLVPPGTGIHAQELETRIALMNLGSWRVLADDGTMERTTPLQPLRGDLDRVQVVRSQQLFPGEPLEVAANLLVEMALTCGAQLAALGVGGTYAWGMVVAEDPRWLHGLVLLDWLHNPRVSSTGELIEDQQAVPGPAATAELQAKLAVFRRLWTPERSLAFARRLPQGALQQVEHLLALSVLGPNLSFDPRYWQGLALQLAVTEVRSLAAEATTAGPTPPAPGRGSAPPPGPGAGRSPTSPPAAPPAAGRAAASATTAAPAPAGPSALARAHADAERRRQDGSSAPAPAVVEVPVSGPMVRWERVEGRLFLVAPEGRLDTAAIRALREGNLDALTRAERPDAEAIEQWTSEGAHFATEVPVLSRLFVDGAPMHRGRWDELSRVTDLGTTVECQLPRVSPVLALLVPEAEGRPRRILITSDLGLAPRVLPRLLP